jgi:hypothetical protein
MQSIVTNVEGDGRGRSKEGAVLWVVGCWGVAVLLAGAAGAFVGIAPPVIPAVVLGTNVLLWMAYRKLPRFRSSVDGIETRWILWFQALRAPIGAAFVFFGAKSVLPERWASHAGWGDLVVGVGAALLAMVASRAPSSRLARRAWGVVGLVDIVTVVVHAQFVALVERDGRFIAMAGRLPFVLIPLFIVPLVFATHALLFARDAGPLDGARAS